MNCPNGEPSLVDATQASLGLPAFAASAYATSCEAWSVLPPVKRAVLPSRRRQHQRSERVDVRFYHRGSSDAREAFLADDS